MQQPDVVAVVPDGRRAGRRVLVPEERHEHDGELQPLARVHGDDLHGRGVGLEASAALLGVVLAGLVDAGAQPLEQRGRAEPVVRRGRVQRLADVPDVGQPALAVGQPHQPLAQAGGGGGLQQRRDAVVVEHARPRAQQVGELVATLVGRLRQLGRGPADERGERRGRHEAADAGARQRREQDQPVAGGRCREDAGQHRDDGRHADGRQGALHGDGVPVDAGEHRDVARLDRPPATVVVGELLLAQRAQDLRGDVRVHELADLADGRVGRAVGRAQRRPGDLPDAHRRSAAQATARPRGLDRVDDDAGIAQRGAGQDRCEPVEHGRVGAPVAVQRLGRRDRTGAQVRGDVGAAEPVDGLLRVADEHEGAVPVERGPQDVPLDRVGVLELVDHDDAVPGADPLRGGGSRLRVGQRVAQEHQQVVVVEHAQRALAPQQLARGRPWPDRRSRAPCPTSRRPVPASRRRR